MQKNVGLFIQLLFLTAFCAAQNPASWKFYSKRAGRGREIYELHISATIDRPWHIYSQNNPKDGPLPTTIELKSNPLLQPEIKAAEIGKLISKHEEAFGMVVNYYENKVEFVWKIKTRGAAKTNISGTVHFMICNNEKCLPPETIPFNVKLN